MQNFIVRRDHVPCSDQLRQRMSVRALQGVVEGQDLPNLAVGSARGGQGAGPQEQ